ncbi:hypothetical protein A0H81_00126 [Grifola frondosa]|uniref:Uncharacterized protein n=1 Tax=Grifola frondosa TaxID=5627 RepID=A0A1C7MSM8_GRIFR|nr:hypothetical protein A0H81_00126 [Grifola frondosa]
MTVHSPTLVSQVFSSNLYSGWLQQKVIQYARTYALSVLSTGIVRGQLRITDSHGTYSFGSPGLQEKSKYPIVSITVLNDNMWARILLSHDMGLSEAYMSGEFETSSLKSLFDLWLENRGSLHPLSTTFSTMVSYISSLAIRAFGRQSLSMAVKNVVEAYDTSNALFKVIRHCQ